MMMLLKGNTLHVFNYNNYGVSNEPSVIVNSSISLVGWFVGRLKKSSF